MNKVKVMKRPNMVKQAEELTSARRQVLDYLVLDGNSVAIIRYL